MTTWRRRRRRAASSSRGGGARRAREAGISLSTHDRPTQGGGGGRRGYNIPLYMAMATGFCGPPGPCPQCHMHHAAALQQLLLLPPVPAAASWTMPSRQPARPDSAAEARLGKPRRINMCVPRRARGPQNPVDRFGNNIINFNFNLRSREPLEDAICNRRGLEPHPFPLCSGGGYCWPSRSRIYHVPGPHVAPLPDLRLARRTVGCGRARKAHNRIKGSGKRLRTQANIKRRRTDRGSSLHPLPRAFSNSRSKTPARMASLV